MWTTSRTARAGWRRGGGACWRAQARGASRTDHLVEGRAPVHVLLCNLLDVRLALVQQVNLVLVLLDAVLELADLGLGLFEVMHFVEQRPRYRAHLPAVVIILQLLFSSRL